MFKYSNVQMFNCSNFQVFKCSNVQISKCSNAQNLKYSNVQMFKFIIQISNVFTMLYRSPHSPLLAEQGSIGYLTDRVENLNLNWVDKSEGCVLLFACWVVMVRKDCSSFYYFRRRTLTYTLSSFPLSMSQLKPFLYKEKTYAGGGSGG